MEDMEPPLFYNEKNKVCQFLKDRYCDVCGVYIDTQDLKQLWELHAVCWQTYRKDGKLYPMPAHVG